MHLMKSATASALVAVAVTVGAGGTAYADPVDPAAGPTVQTVQTVPGLHQVDKQAALEHMLNELGVGWANGGAAGTAIGAVVGLGIGCISMFPGSLAGCIIGLPTGAVAGALIGMYNGNPNAQKAIEDYINTP
ncbi:MAG: hypothetical protein WAW17_30465 [Rhodococcus sp. (in: high G+C Gram-positive bacteria)]|uniref:hypothetical protein n=1 Tax=Rhodococcus sp. TaxID=1831 RepID=UPI003BB06C04